MLAMFGISRQAIYADKARRWASTDCEAGRPTACPYRLRINCRNATRNAEAVTITSGMSPGYSRILNTADSADVDPVFYRSPSHQGDLLLATIAKLLKSFAPAEIVVLSMRADASSCVARRLFSLISRLCRSGSSSAIWKAEISSLKSPRDMACIAR
jgi:hypothetical protein